MARSLSAGMENPDPESTVDGGWRGDVHGEIRQRAVASVEELTIRIF